MRKKRDTTIAGIKPSENHREQRYGIKASTRQPLGSAFHLAQSRLYRYTKFKALFCRELYARTGEVSITLVFVRIAVWAM
jgi:hypothetical protein